MNARQYSSQVLDHFRHPRNVGSIDPADTSTGTGLAGTLAHGQVMKLQLCIQQDGIESACFKAYGCAAAIAAGSWLTERLQGQSIEQAQALQGNDIVQALELPPDKLHCALLAEDALQAALADYLSKQSPGRKSPDVPKTR